LSVFLESLMQIFQQDIQINFLTFKKKNKLNPTSNLIYFKKQIKNTVATATTFKVEKIKTLKNSDLSFSTRTR